ncbi:hypothetical protein [Plantibacter sp. CFBP 8775]|uniref:hypothetical protein n=1 Tax=Plantibacter sp. CFBP 8775 TaxID=2774038 RepID=UPI0017842555|nr:hypothetical protein [Plantibacter sp. CFBP 8775]MBD8102489.1 hypothetical protein [Plantibacter sp. CFBP 8775]
MGLEVLSTDLGAPDQYLGPSVWDIVTDAGIPSLALLVSAGIAIWLARSESKRAEKARVEEQTVAAQERLIEQEAAAQMRETERRTAREDRESERRDRHLEELLEIYGFFVAANPQTESWLPIMRRLRAKLVILQTIPSALALADWLVAESKRGTDAMAYAMENPYLDTPEDPEYMKWQGPMAQWAQDMMNSIASWMRGTVTDADIRETLRRRQETQDGAAPAG